MRSRSPCLVRRTALRCEATGKSREQALDRGREAVYFHLGRLRLDGFPIPEAQSAAEYLTVWRMDRLLSRVCAASGRWC